MSDILFLNCLVLGDTLDCIFPVKIASSETVGILREVIKVKKHHAFHGIDADQLNLYRTSEEVANLDDDELIQALTIPLKQAKHKKLGPQFPLSNSFSNALPLSVLHVLVELPSTCEFLVIYCWSTNHDPADSQRSAICLYTDHDLIVFFSVFCATSCTLPQQLCPRESPRS